MLAAHMRFPRVVATIFLVYLAVEPLTAGSATYDYGAPQVAPSIAATLDTPQIAAILNETAPNKPYLVAYQLKTTDANDNTAGAAPLKVVPTDDSQHPYLAVFHNQINSTQFATPLAGTTSTLALDVFIPPNQPNQSWLGAVQLYLSCPSANFNNQYIGQAELTGKPVGQFSTFTYPIPGPIETVLKGSHPDCSFSMAVNMNQTPTPPVVDNLRFQ